MLRLRTSAFVLIAFSIPLLGNAQKWKWKTYGHQFPEPNAKFSISVIHDDRSRWALGEHWQRTINPSFILDYYKDWHKDSVFLKVNLDSLTAKLVRENVSSPQSYHSKLNSKSNVLTVRPNAMISIDVNKNYTLSFQIEAVFVGTKDSQKWKEQYWYTTPDDKPLFGKESLTANDGEFLKRLAEQGLSKCISALFMDLKGPNAGWKNDLNLPEELKAMPKGSWNQLPEGTVVLQETRDDWVTRQPIIMFGKPTGGSLVIIVSKDKSRLLAHALGSRDK